MNWTAFWGFLGDIGIVFGIIAILFLVAFGLIVLFDWMIKKVPTTIAFFIVLILIIFGSATAVGLLK